MNQSTPLDDTQYVSRRSYRKDGSAADTPVWVAHLGGKLMIFTLDDSYKVNRIARNPAVQLDIKLNKRLRNSIINHRLLISPQKPRYPGRF